MKFKMETNQLTHWGVKGMKWGVRRYQNKDGSLTSAGKKRYEAELAKIKEEAKVVRNQERAKAKMDKLDTMRKDLEDRKRKLSGEDDGVDNSPTEKKSNRQADLRTKSVRKMTDEEIRAHMDRLQLEKDYKKLLSDNYHVTTERGKDFVSKVIEKSAENITTQLLTYGMGTAVNKIAKAELVNPKKGQKDK